MLLLHVHGMQLCGWLCAVHAGNTSHRLLVATPATGSWSQVLVVALLALLLPRHCRVPRGGQCPCHTAVTLLSHCCHTALVITITCPCPAGLAAAGHSAFVLVAGGLGERLGYSGIKLSLPAELATGRCFLQLYIEHILALQVGLGGWCCLVQCACV